MKKFKDPFKEWDREINRETALKKKCLLKNTKNMHTFENDMKNSVCSFLLLTQDTDTLELLL